MSDNAPAPVAHLDPSQTNVLFYGCPFEDTGYTCPRVAAGHNNAQDILRDHIDAHMTGYPYVCAVCCGRYKRECDYKRHFNEVHSHLKRPYFSHPKAKKVASRPPNAFTMFRSELCARSRASGQDISKMAGELWKGMSEDDRRPYTDKAHEDRRKFKLAHSHEHSVRRRARDSAGHNVGASSSASNGAGQHKQGSVIHNVFPSPLGHPVWSETDPYHASAPSSYQFAPF